MHNLEMTERGATLIYNRQQGSVWHRLGTPVEGEFAAECVSQAIGDWEVETSPLYHRVQNSGTDGKEFASFKMVPDQVVIRRSDNKVKIGMATKNYVPIQNRFGFSFFDKLVQEGEAKYTSAGVLGNGERVFLVASTKGQIHIGGEDTVEPFVVLDLPHTGKDAAQYCLSSVRPICQNTLNGAIAGANHIGRIRHRGDVKAKLEMAGEILKTAGAYYSEFGAACRFMSGQMVDSEESLRDYITYAVTGKRLDWLSVSERDEIGVRNQNRIMEAQRLFDGGGRGSSLKTTRGTWWGAYNAMTELVDHRIAAGRKKELQYAGYGAGKEIKERAFTQALKHATKSA